MTIGKRKGYTAKGAGAQPNADNTKKVGGSLSKNDHWYINQAFGMVVDPGAAAGADNQKASGGVITTWKNEDAVKAGNILVSANSSIHNKVLKLLKPVR